MVFFLNRPRMAMAPKSRPLSGQRFHWPPCSPDLQISRARDVGIKALLTQQSEHEKHFRGVKKAPPGQEQA